MTIAAALDASPAPAPSAARGATNDPLRRAKPRIIDTDWLVLRGMRRVIPELAARCAKPGDVVLDFGSGASPYRDLFEAMGCTHRAADFEGAELTISPDGRLPGGDGWADGIASFQVLEHVRDLPTYFAEAARTLKPGGWMLLSTHGTWLYHPHPEDHRRWTREGLIGDIEANGFVVEDCAPVVGPLAWTTMLRLTCACYALRRIPLIGPALCALLAAPTNVRAWVEDRITPAWVTRDNACVYVTLCRKREAA